MNSTTLLQMAIFLICMCGFSTTALAQLSVVVEPNMLWQTRNDGTTCIRVSLENPKGYQTEKQGVS